MSEIRLGPQSTTGRDENGTELWSFGYDGDPDQAVALLTRTLGAPTVTEYAGSPNTDFDLPASIYDWGGLRLESPHYNGTPDHDGSSFYGVTATSNRVDGVALVTPSGVAVGMTEAEMNSRHASTTPPEWGSPENRYLEAWTRLSTSGGSLTDWVAARIRGGRVDQLFTAHSYGP